MATTPIAFRREMSPCRQKRCYSASAANTFFKSSKAQYFSWPCSRMADAARQFAEIALLCEILPGMCEKFSRGRIEATVMSLLAALIDLPVAGGLRGKTQFRFLQFESEAERRALKTKRSDRCVEPGKQIVVSEPSTPETLFCVFRAKHYFNDKIAKAKWRRRAFVRRR